MRTRCVLVVAGVLLLAGCGEVAPDADAGAAAELAAEVAAWWGTEADAQAGAVLVAYSLNGETDQCLAERGYPRFDWRASIMPTGGVQPYVGAIAGLEGSMLFADDYERSLRAPDVERTLNSPPDRSKDEVAAEDACLEESRETDVSDDALEDIGLPSVVAQLRERWQETAAEAEAPVIDDDELTACVESKDLPELRGGSVDELAHLADEVQREIEAEKLSVDETVARFAAWDGAVTGALRECAEPYAEAADEAVVAAYEEFEREHADRIEQAKAAWVGVRREAEELGWSPDDPYAGYTQGTE